MIKVQNSITPCVILLCILMQGMVLISKEYSGHRTVVRKRVLERNAQKEAKNEIQLLAQKTNSADMQELAASLQNMHRLLEIMELPSIDQAIDAVKKMKKDAETLLTALSVSSMEEAIELVTHMQSLLSQFSHMQTKIKKR